MKKSAPKAKVQKATSEAEPHWEAIFVESQAQLTSLLQPHKGRVQRSTTRKGSKGSEGGIVMPEAPPRSPSLASAMKELRTGDPAAAAAQFRARLRANPKDQGSRVNYAIALYEAGRWKQAAQAFRRALELEKPESKSAVPMQFFLGCCLLQLNDNTGSLLATTYFLDLSNTEHPWYWEGVADTAFVWSHLGAHRDAASLCLRIPDTHCPDDPSFLNWLALTFDALDRPREGAYVLECARDRGEWNDVLARNYAYLKRKDPRPSVRPTWRGLSRAPWSRERIIRTSFRILGIDAKPRPPSVMSWGGSW